jgi:acetylglutamate kinase
VQDLIAKAETLLEALPYIQKFSGATFVVKYGGSFMDSPDDERPQRRRARHRFSEAVEINPVVVHGGGKAITRAMEKAGLKANFIQGQRVTDEATVKIVDDVLSREINPEIVKTINALGGRPWLCRAGHFQVPQALARRQGKSRPKIDIGYVGEVIEVNVAPLARNPSGAASRRSSARPRAARTGKFTTATPTSPPRWRHRAQGQAARVHERRARP